MDRCPTCGAAVRPGAKFCTSCGTRLSEHVSGKSSESTWGTAPDPQDTPVSPPAETGEPSTTEDAVATPEPDWGQAVEDTAGDDSQQAATAETTTDTDWPTTETATETTGEKEEIPPNEGTGWSSSWPGSETDSTDSPASRFETGLGDAAAPESTDEQPDTAETEEPAPGRSTWSWRSPAKEADTSWEPLAPEPEPTVSDTDDVSVERQAESLDSDPVAGDVAVAATSVGATSVDGEDQDSRQRASDLVDELRQLVWTIGVDDAPGAGHKNTIQTVSRVRGETSDFADLASAITAVRENPRDVDALRELGQKADRLQELLDSHGRLTSTLDEVIDDLR